MTMPSAIARTVMMRTVRTPLKTGGVNMLSNMKPQLKASLVTNMCTNIAARTASTAIATHRPGCRTGTALTASGGAGRTGVSVVIEVSFQTKSHTGVDLRVVDRTIAHSILVKDLW